MEYRIQISCAVLCVLYVWAICDTENELISHRDVVDQCHLSSIWELNICRLCFRSCCRRQTVVRNSAPINTISLEWYCHFLSRSAKKQQARLVWENEINGLLFKCTQCSLRAKLLALLTPPVASVWGRRWPFSLLCTTPAPVPLISTVSPLSQS